MPIRKPFEGNFKISQHFGGNASFYGQFSYGGVPLKGHNGIDFALPTGTTILSTDAGVVEETGFEEKGFGNYVKISHAWGESLYAHLSQINVQKAQKISAGQPIGQSGESGAATGPHLHIGIRISPYDKKDGWGGFSDPEPYLTLVKTLSTEKAQENCLQVVIPGDSQSLGWYRTEWKKTGDKNNTPQSQLSPATDEQEEANEESRLWREEITNLAKEFSGNAVTADPIKILRLLLSRLPKQPDPELPDNWEIQ